MGQYTLQNADKPDFPERQPFPNNSVFEAKILSCDEQESRWPVDDNDPDGPKKMQLSLKFEVIDPEGEFNDRWVWGNCSAYLSTDPRNKLRQWTQGILDLDVLPEGYILNTDEFVGRQARIVIGAKPKADGSGRTSNFVIEVRPSRFAQPEAASTAPKTAAEFRAQNQADEDEPEPF